MVLNNKLDSNKLLEILLTKPGGQELLIKLLRIIDPTIDENDLNIEQLKKISAMDSNELILSILDKPEGLETLIEVAQFAGIDTARLKNVNADQIKLVLQSSKTTSQPQKADDAQITEANGEAPETSNEQKLNAFSENLQKSSDQKLHAIAEGLKKRSEQKLNAVAEALKKRNEQKLNTFTETFKKANERKVNTFAKALQKSTTQKMKMVSAVSKKMSEQNSALSSLQTTDSVTAGNPLLNIAKNTLPVQVFSHLFQQASGLTKFIPKPSTPTAEEEQVEPSAPIPTTEKEQTEQSIPKNLSEALLQLAEEQKNKRAKS